MDGEKDPPSKDLRGKLLLGGGTLYSMQDPSSQTRDQTHAPCSGSSVFTTAPPGKSQEERFCQKKACAKVLRWA